MKEAVLEEKEDFLLKSKCDISDAQSLCDVGKIVCRVDKDDSFDAEELSLQLEALFKCIYSLLENANEALDEYENQEELKK